MRLKEKKNHITKGFPRVRLCNPRMSPTSSPACQQLMAAYDNTAIGCYESSSSSSIEDDHSLIAQLVEQNIAFADDQYLRIMKQCSSCIQCSLTRRARCCAAPSLGSHAGSHYVDACTVQRQPLQSFTAVARPVMHFQCTCGDDQHMCRRQSFVAHTITLNISPRQYSCPELAPIHPYIYGRHVCLLSLRSSTRIEVTLEIRRSLGPD